MKSFLKRFAQSYYVLYINLRNGLRCILLKWTDLLLFRKRNKGIHCFCMLRLVMYRPPLTDPQLSGHPLLSGD